MKYSQKEIRLYRSINVFFTILSIIIILYLNKPIGFGLLALSLLFLFRPFNKDEKLDEYELDDKELNLKESIEDHDFSELIDNNFVIIAKLISTYFMELSTSKYNNRFKNKTALFTTIGILDAYVYVFNEKSISLQQVKNLAAKSLKEENPLLEFTIGMGILISSIDNIVFSIDEIEEVWEFERETVLQIINNVINNYPNNSEVVQIVQKNSENFFNNRKIRKHWNEIGIL